VDRLRAAGLTVTSTYGVDRELTALSRQGSAVVLWFYVVAAGFSVLLAIGGLSLVASVDRDRTASDLRHMRWQGLSRRELNRASLWGNLAVGAGRRCARSRCGLVGLARRGRPVCRSSDDSAVAVPPPRSPVPLAVMLPWAVAVLLCATVAVVGGGAGAAGGRAPPTAGR
jgi:hypothetical protein